MRFLLSIGILSLTTLVVGALVAQEKSVSVQSTIFKTHLQSQISQAPVSPSKSKDDRPTFFDGIRRIIGDNPAFDDSDATESLVESLNNAEKVYNEIRQSNREAIRGMNRQIRVGSARQSPHIIVITVPQLRFDQLPAMTRLRGIRTSGMTFTNYYAAADNLPDSRWSFLSSRLATKSPSNQQLNRKECLAEALWQSGYKTTLIGTWTSNQHPVELGYDHWTGFPSSSGVVARYPEFFFTQSTRAKIVSSGGKSQPTAHSLICEEVTSYLERNQKSSRQFYLHVGLPFIQGTKTEENISEVDQSIGKIVDSINELGLAGRVCLMVTGERSHKVSAEINKELPVVNQKLTYSQSGLNEGNLRTPLIVFWAGRAQRGSVSDFPCTGVDFLPTVLKIAASNKKMSSIDGVSLLSEIQGKNSNIERLLYWRTKEGGQAARRGRWKVILKDSDDKLELYDLEQDPSESHDVSNQHPDIVKGFIADPKSRKKIDSQTL